MLRRLLCLTLSNMRLFTLRELGSASADTLSSAFRARLAHQRSVLAASRDRLPSHLHAAHGRIQRGLDAAEADDSDVSALAEIESGAASAVDELRGSTFAAPATQVFLRSIFSSLVGQRALVQSASANSSDDAAGSLLLPGVELHALLENAVEDARAFCREKHGDSPETRVLRVVASGGGSTAAAGDEDSILLAPCVTFPVHELLKNAMGAHCRLVGADRLDKLPPVEVRHGIRDGQAFVSVTDYGGGLAAESGDAMSFLATTNPEREANYTYSRNFGAPFEGLGMGLPLAGLHARYHGGALTVRSVTGGSTSVRHPGVHAGFTLRCCGEQPEPEEVLPLLSDP